MVKVQLKWGLEFYEDKLRRLLIRKECVFSDHPRMPIAEQPG